VKKEEKVQKIFGMERHPTVVKRILERLKEVQVTLKEVREEA
jgi:hypothetical protein